jgi:hypothetical protein
MRSRLPQALVWVLATVLSTPAAQGQVVLKPKLQPKTTRVYNSETITKQILTLAGMDIETRSAQFTIAEQALGVRGADGTLRLVETIRKLQQELTLPGFKVTFDSSNPGKKAPLPQLEPMLDLLRAISKAKTTLVHNKLDQVIKVEGTDELIKGLDPAVRKNFSDQFAPEIVLSRWNNRNQRIPSKPVRVGDKWEHTSVLDLEAGQKIRIKRRYSYTGTVKQGPTTLHRITSRSLEVTLSQDAPEGSPTKITASKLKVAKGTGEILVDLEHGIIFSDSDTTRMTGTLTIEANGMKTPGRLDLTIATQTKVDSTEK